MDMEWYGDVTVGFGHAQEDFFFWEPWIKSKVASIQP